MHFQDSKCTISPKSPSSLTTEEGGLVNNTQNVEIDCSCMDSNGAAIRNVRWLSPNKLSIRTKDETIDGAPYSNLTGDETVAVLIVPNFNDTYSGRYTCTTGNTTSTRTVMSDFDCML